MATTRKSLGRGLSALIPDNDMDFLSRVARGEPLESATMHSSGTQSTSQLPTEHHTNESSNESGLVGAADMPQITEWINPKEVEANPYQPRRTFSSEEMQELVASVREHGILQPILVRPLLSNTSQKRFQLVAGERRWRAASEAGLERIPTIIRNVTDQQSLELALIENVQRHDLSALDAARAYSRLIQDFQLGQTDVARRVGKSRSSVANTIRLLDLPEEVQKALEDGELSEGHGRAILGASGEGAQRAIFRRILRDKLSVREAERLARQAVEGEVKVGGQHQVDGKIVHDQLKRPVEYSQVAKSIQKSLGARVSIRPKDKGGQISIRCTTAEELERVIQLLVDVGE